MTAPSRVHGFGHSTTTYLTPHHDSWSLGPASRVSAGSALSDPSACSCWLDGALGQMIRCSCFRCPATIGYSPTVWSPARPMTLLGRVERFILRGQLSGFANDDGYVKFPAPRSLVARRRLLVHGGTRWTTAAVAIRFDAEELPTISPQHSRSKRRTMLRCDRLFRCRMD